MNYVLGLGFITFFIAFWVTKSLVPYLIKFGTQYNLLDKNEERKQNNKEMVRIGGISILIGFLISQFFTFIFLNFNIFPNVGFNLNIIPLLFSILFFFIIGLFDDLFNLSPYLRLFFQTFGMSFVWANGLSINSLDISFLPLNSNVLVLSPLTSYLITFLWLVGVTNAINWIDGLDGLSTGITLINFLGIAVISFSLENISIFYLSLSLAGCCIGFLIFNFFPSKIYMGDSGSYLIGFSLACLSLLTFSDVNSDLTNNLVFLQKSFLLVLVPFLDMFVVIFLRLRSGKSPFFPDRLHLHFRLLDRFKDVKKTVFTIYGLVFSSTIIAIFL